MNATAYLIRWLAAAAIAFGNFTGAAQDSADEAPEKGAAEELPLAPEPAPGKRQDLPAVFTKEAPETVDDLKVIERHVKKLISRVSAAVVSVQVGGGVGSGVLISEDGLILTVAHVSGESSRNARVIFPDGTTARGKTLGANYGIDSGLIRITDSGKWPHVDTGLLDDARTGDWVLAFGHPGGFDRERSHVVRLGRVIRLSGGLVQTDCTLTGGDSGGPLFDMHGRVIGIHSRISESTTGNFHVPINTYHETWRRLAGGENWGQDRPPMRRAYVGVRGVDDSAGCRLEWVDEAGPAFKAGIRVGDIVVKINDHAIKDSASFVQYLSETRPGDELELHLKRDDMELTVTVTAESWWRRRR